MHLHGNFRLRSISHACTGFMISVTEWCLLPYIFCLNVLYSNTRARISEAKHSIKEGEYSIEEGDQQPWARDCSIEIREGEMDKVVSVPKFDGSGLLMKPSLCGSLERNQSSGLAVTGEDEYIASLYYQQCDPQTLEIYFVITWDIE